MLVRFCGRRVVLPCLAALALAAITCRSYAYFDLDLPGTAQLAQGDAPATVPLQGLAALNIAQHHLMATQGLALTDVTHAAITRATLAVQLPATGVDLSFLAHVDVVLSADGMQPLTVASGGDFAPGVNLVPLTVSEPLVTGYLKGKNPTVTLTPTWAGPVPQGLTLELNLVAQVRVGEPGGSCQT
jgi:hypothetical protein